MRTKITMRSLALLAVVVGAGISAQGCVIESSNPGTTTCLPDLYVNWVVVDSSDIPLTCASVGAVSVTGQVGGLTDQVVCPAASSSGPQLFFPLATSGTYAVNVQLRDGGGNILSQTHQTSPPSLFVDCSGLTETPTIFLSIN